MLQLVIKLKVFHGFCNIFMPTMPGLKMETEVHVEMEVHGRGRMGAREVVLLIFSESKSVVVFNQFCFQSCSA